MIKPLGNLVLIEKIETGEKVTAGGLVISAQFADNGPAKGRVIDIGDGEQNYKGEIIPVPEINIDDIVYFPPHSGTEVEDDGGKKYLLVSCKNILAVKK